MVRSTSRNRAAGTQAATNTNRSDDTSNQAPRTAAQTVSGETAASATVNSQEHATGSTGAASPQANLPAQMEQRALGSVNAPNAFEAYGQQMSVNTIVGTLIKFSKGDWIMGDDEDVPEEVLAGLVANMDQLMVGWIKWVDNKPAEQIMGPIAEGFQPPRRNELGDTDQTQWEQDDQGRPRDPWQFSNYIVLKTPGEEASEENLYTFATSSKGGLGAIGKLCKDYGREMRRRPDEYPIVKLGADSYTHPQYGRTYVPMISITGWEAKSDFEMVSGSTEEAQPEPEPAPRQAAGGRSRRR